MDETRRQAALALCSRELGVLNVSDFTARLILQKTIYLLQGLHGLDLGYRYSWYLRGPYSSTLTRDVFEIVENRTLQDSIWQRHKLSSSAKDILTRFKRAVFDTKPADMDLAVWLELLSSTHYLLNDPSRKDKSKSAIHAELLKLKPHFKNYVSAFDTAWHVITSTAER